LKFFVEKVVSLSEKILTFCSTKYYWKNIEKYWKSGLIEHYWKVLKIRTYWTLLKSIENQDLLNTIEKYWKSGLIELYWKVLKIRTYWTLLKSIENQDLLKTIKKFLNDIDIDWTFNRKSFNYWTLIKDQ